MPFAIQRQAPPLDRQPVVTLVRWLVFALPTGTRHFCGIHKGDDPTRGRVSTDIVGFDPATSTGMTASGRLYRLEGPPGDDAVVDLVLRRWLASAGLSPEAASLVPLENLAALPN